jgi:hypothetical protein
MHAVSAVGGRCIGIVSVNRAGARDSSRLRQLKLLARRRPMLLTVSSMIGRDVPERERGRAVQHCGVQPLFKPFDKENLCWLATGCGTATPGYGEVDGDSKLLRLSMAK